MLPGILYSFLMLYIMNSIGILFRVIIRCYNNRKALRYTKK